MEGKMKIAKVLLTSLVVIFISLCLFSGEIYATTEKLKSFPVGALWPMTGPFSYYGRIMSHGAMTAIDQINGAGGIKGYGLNLIITDFRKADVGLAVSGARKMISIDKVPFIVTAFSATTLGVQPIAAANKVLMINAAAGAPVLNNKPFLYNVKMHYGLLLPHSLKFMWDRGYRKLGLVVLNDPAGIVSREETIKPLWTKWGGEIVASEMNEIGEVDFSAQMARVKAAKPDWLLLLETGETQAYAIKGARDMGLTQPILATEYSEVIAPIVGKERTSNIIVAADTFDRTTTDSKAQKFVKDYESRFGDEAETYSANFYDAIYILAELIKRVVDKGGNALDGGQLEAAIWDNPKFDTVYGKISFKKDGTVRKSVNIYEVTQGVMKLLKSIPPSE